MTFTITEILPGLSRFTIPFPNDDRRTVNSYLFTAGREALLLDAAWDTEAGEAALRAALQRAGLEPAAVRQVVITHLHPDHIGLAGMLHALGARVSCHPAETAQLLQRFRRLDEFRASSHLWERLNGAPEDAMSSFQMVAGLERTLEEVPEPDLPLEGGELLQIGDFRLRPIWTPGHTLGHLCYYEETRQLLFTGDHVLPTITPHTGLYFHATGIPLLNYLDSLKLLKAYHPALVLPAHGDVFTDLHARLDELQAHHHERGEELYAIVGDEPLSGWQVASRARWTRRHVPLSEIAPHHRRLALAETLAHLELLRAEGRLEKDFVPGLIRYRRPPS